MISDLLNVSAKILVVFAFVTAMSACTENKVPLSTAAVSAPAQTVAAAGQDFTTMYDEARAKSGVDEAYAALDSRLADLCDSEIDREECIAQHMVRAYSANEGETICRAETVAGTFIDCIINGKLLAQVAAKLNTSEINRSDLWGDRDDAWQRMNKVMYAAAQERCGPVDVADQADCFDNFALDTLEISPFDVRNCPQSMVRDDCIVGTAIASLIQRGLLNL